jgi:5-(carboxyamino)imidazole ribonucleotide synthase
MMNKSILPGSTIGILGSGQLGRMLALAARAMGYRVHVFSPGSDTPTGQVADVEVSAPYEDLDAMRDFARQVDVVTYEFENVPTVTAVACAEVTPLRPGAQALHVSQNRHREKQFFADNGLPVTPFTAVHSGADLQAGLTVIGCPAVLKTVVSGYDGKGQIKIDDPAQAAGAYKALGQPAAILEGWVEFERELSVVAARGVEGDFAHYNLIDNTHRRHILDISQAPAGVPPEVLQEAVAMTRCVLEALDVVGVLCVEFFLTADHKLLLNEIAPRPHNSGHLTIDACVTGQFEQQLRAVCGLSLGQTTYVRPAAMANLLGDLWAGGEPDWTAVTAIPGLKLHLYGKHDPRPGRKMGHITALAETAPEAVEIVKRARQALVRRLETRD